MGDIYYFSIPKSSQISASEKSLGVDTFKTSPALEIEKSDSFSNNLATRLTIALLSLDS